MFNGPGLSSGGFSVCTQSEVPISHARQLNGQGCKGKNWLRKELEYVPQHLELEGGSIVDGGIEEL